LLYLATSVIQIEQRVRPGRRNLRGMAGKNADALDEAWTKALLDLRREHVGGLPFFSGTPPAIGTYLLRGRREAMALEAVIGELDQQKGDPALQRKTFASALERVPPAYATYARNLYENELECRRERGIDTSALEL
jgi:hypothetical protein